MAKKRPRPSNRAITDAVRQALTAHGGATERVFVGRPSRRGTFKPSDKTLLDRVREAQAAKAPPPRPPASGPPGPPSARDHALVAGVTPKVGEDVRGAIERVECFDAFKKEQPYLGADVPPIAARVMQSARNAHEVGQDITLKERIEKEGVRAQMRRKAK